MPQPWSPQLGQGHPETWGNTASLPSTPSQSPAQRQGPPGGPHAPLASSLGWGSPLLLGERVIVKAFWAEAPAGQGLRREGAGLWENPVEQAEQGWG